MHFRDHADVYIYITSGVYRKGAEFIGNKHTDSFTDSQTLSYTVVSDVNKTAVLKTKTKTSTVNTT